MLTDTHCHLNLNLFQEDITAVLERAQAAGVDRIMVPGIDLESSRAAIRLAEQHDAIFAAVGVHPNDAAGWDKTWLDELEQMAKHPRVVAIGEIGLDYYRDRCPRAKQLAALEAQLALAKACGLPVVLHSRQSLGDMWAVLQSWVSDRRQKQAPPEAAYGVLHSYEGPAETACALIEAGFYIGINGPVTFKNAFERHDIVRVLSLERLLLETDAPYLTPHPHRGQRNEPAYIPLIAQKIADLKAVPVATVAETTSINADRLFRWRAFVA